MALTPAWPTKEDGSPLAGRDKRSSVRLALISALAVLAAASSLRAVSSTIVISEFRTRGPNGATDEFIEIYNLSSGTVDISSWSIDGSNASGTIEIRARIPTGTTLSPGCRYLFTNSNQPGYSGSVPGDRTFSIGITDDGGIALRNASGTIIDQVGMSAGSAFKEGTPLAQLAANANRSYERRPGGAAGNGTDTDNNAADFFATTSNPQNSSSGCVSTTPSPTNPSGVGLANPSSVAAGGSTLLTVAVTPGTNPTSTGLSVTADLTTIRGSATQSFFDDGTNGDTRAGDSTFSFRTTVSRETNPGAKTLTATIADSQGRRATTSIGLTVTPAETPANPSGVGAAIPTNVAAGESTLLSVAVTPGTNPASTGLTVTANLGVIGGSTTQTFYDDATNGDVTAGDNVFSFRAIVAASTAAGTKTLTITITDGERRNATASIVLTVAAASRGVVDLNGDGLADAFVYNVDTGEWSREMGNGSGAFNSTTGTWAAGWQIFGAEFNGDARTDLFLYNDQTGEWSKAVSDETDGFTIVSGACAAGWQVLVLDLDGDTRSDVFLYNPTNGAWSKCFHQSNSDFACYAGAWSSGLSLYVGDWDGDRRGDLFLYNRTTGEWTRATNDSTADFRNVTDTWSPGWSIHPGDFNSDGRTDLFLYNRETGGWQVCTTTGEGFGCVTGESLAGWSVSVGDFDANGYADLLFYDAGSGNWLQMLNDTQGGFASYTGSWTTGYQLWLTDFNADRKTDVLLYNAVTGAWIQATTTVAGAFSYTEGAWPPGLTVVATRTRLP